ncbi:MAG: FHA domain-containing protein [Alphaproteobacteria bacterium]|nr:FHA domain-containing protein [Alphaproteobacteria bacterium]
MRLILRIENQPSLANGQPLSRTLERQDLRLGRSADADWQLPDPQKLISSEHAEILYRDGTYVVCDRSRNGTLVNGERLASDGRERPLQDGDVIAIGHYDISVQVASASGRQEPDRAIESSVVEDLPGPQGARLSDPAARPEALAAFMRGAGVDPGAAHSLGPAAFERAGRTFRLLAGGLSDLLRRQGEMKSVLGVERTTLHDTGNNPFKFADAPADLIERVFAPRFSDLPGPEAAEQALESVRLHEIRLLTAISDAVRSIVARLSPQEIREQAANAGDNPEAAKAAWWDEIERLHAALLADDGSPLEELIEQELRNAFTRHL